MLPFLKFGHIYLFVRDLVQQRLNAHSQTPRGRHAYHDW